MAVDPKLPRKILVVHGVQAGTDEDQKQDESIRRLVTARLNGLPVRFEVELYRYENVNDAAQRRLRDALGLLTSSLLARRVLDQAADVVGDVAIALHDGSTAASIRAGLRERIMDVFRAGNPLYVVAHSLGTIYSFDVINQLACESGCFDRTSRRTWPVQAFMTLGSPLGLEMFQRRRVKAMPPGHKTFRWINHWDRLDPIVTGSFYGRPQEGYEIVERFADPDSGWFVQDRPISTSAAWLLAHVGYWTNPVVGDDLAGLIAS